MGASTENAILSKCASWQHEAMLYVLYASPCGRYVKFYAPENDEYEYLGAFVTELKKAV